MRRYLLSSVDAGLIDFFYFKKNSILLFTKEIKYGTIST